MCFSSLTPPFNPGNGSDNWFNLALVAIGNVPKYNR